MSEPSELPPIAGAALSVVLLASPQASSITNLLADWTALLKGLGRDYEIIVVDAGNSHVAADMAAKFLDRPSGVQFLSPEGRRGFGAALRTGLAATRYPLVFYTTLDHQFQPAGLKRFLELIGQVHLVSGFRVSAPMPWWLRGLGYLYRGLVRILIGETLPPRAGWLGWRGLARRLLARIFFGIRLPDVDCAFRLFRRSIFARIPIQSDSAFAQVEVLAKANFLGCLMTEEPVNHRAPVAAADPTYAPIRQTLREAYQVLSRPDFGPAILPPELPFQADHAKNGEAPLSVKP